MLPPDIELRAVQLPARQDRMREPPLTNVEVIVDHLLGATAELPRLPTAIFGHSFGALLAYELSRKLREHGDAPFSLIASARRAPHLPNAHPPLHKLPDADFLSGLNRYCNTPWDTLCNEELMQLAMPALRADFEALETFVHASGAPLEVPTVVLRGRCDTSVSQDAAFAWREVLAHEPHLHELDADHFFVDTHREWVVERVIEALSS